MEVGAKNSEREDSWVNSSDILAYSKWNRKIQTNLDLHKGIVQLMYTKFSILNYKFIEIPISK